MYSFKCSECSYNTKRKFDLKRHLENIHGVDIQQNSQLGDGLPRHPPKSEPEDGLYTKKEFEETMATLRARFPTMNFDTIDPRFIHPFTAIIAGPSSSESQCFVCV